MKADQPQTTDRDRNAWGAALEKYVDQHGGCVPVYTADFGAVGLIAIAVERERCAAIVRRCRFDEHATVMLQEIENGG